MKIKKNILALILVTVVGISIVGCGKNEKKSQDNEKNSETVVAKEEKSEDKEEELTKTEETKSEEATKTEETKSEEATKTEETKSEETTTQVATKQADTSAVVTTSAPKTPAQKLDALVKGLNGKVSDMTKQNAELLGASSGKNIAFGDISIGVVALDEAKITPALKAKLEMYKKNHGYQASPKYFVGAYYNKGIFALSSKPNQKMDPRVIAIMDTFE